MFFSEQLSSSVTMLVYMYVKKLQVKVPGNSWMDGSLTQDN
jgi:hypothetical protein